MTNQLQRLLKANDVPLWYRGLSNYQISASETLLHAIRDDLEQGSSYRVKNCLTRLGLTPPVSTKMLKIILSLCGGSDLAFLFFLLEANYTRKKRGPKYSLNQQLIMSAIAILDTMMTIRELDRMLPPGHLSKRDQLIEEQKRRRSSQIQKVVDFSQNNNSQQKKNPQFILPYFEKLRRPNLQTTNFMSHAPDFKVSFPFDGSNTNYRIPNEKRWFANFKFQPVKRLVKEIISNGIEDLFYRIENDLSTNVEFRSLCHQHRAMEKNKEREKNELIVQAKERCMKMIYDVEKMKKNNRTKILEKLEVDINKYVNKYAKCSRATFSTVKTTTGEPCEICNKLLQQTDKKQDWLKTVDGLNAKTNERKLNDDDGGKVNLIYSNKEAKEYYKHCEAANTPLSKQQKLKNMGYLYGQTVHSESACKIPNANDSKLVFASQSLSRPYQFDYPSIYNVESDCCMSDKIKKTCIKALDTSCANSQNSFGNNIFNTADAVTKCVKNIWQKNLALKQIEMEKAKKKSLVNTKPKRPSQGVGLDFGMDYYDANDNALMDRMLREAIEVMKKDPRYVLASFPEAHKLPILSEWIRRRYGKTYTKAEQDESYKLSRKIFEEIVYRKNFTPEPNMMGFSALKPMSYSCHEYAKRMCNKIRRDYYRTLNKTLMEKATYCWYSMGTFLCPNGPPRNTFFAYMPSHSRDITRYKIWKTHEFRDVKRFWDQRQFILHTKRFHGLG